MLGGAAAAWPLAARAQQAAKLPTIGFLGAGTLSAWSLWVAAFVQRLRELGWIEGRAIAIEYRWAEGRSERFTEIGAEFVRLKVDVIVTVGTAVAALQELLAQRDAKLREAQEAQAELLRKQRELDDAKRELDLTVEKRVQASLSEIRQKARMEAEESLKLKVAEKEQQISSMQRQIDELKRKAEQGSQQLQGEVLELELEATLRAHFPLDRTEPVGKGEFGGDVLQGVVSPVGQACGALLWETKRTKNWADGWLAKLRADQRAAGAEFAVLVSNALPKEVDTFGYVDGIWVTDFRFVVPLAIALRQSLIEVATARQAQEGQETKMELVYQYLTGPKFRHRVEAIVEKFSDMQADLDRERKAMTRLWAKRETQILGVIESTVGMYGDLQGIAGKALQEIEALQIPLLEASLQDEALEGA
jgi:hypothetical protein